ncbi:Nitrite/Sulfite reductase ferredoxin-like half domain-containing protein [Desulforamulus putei DSM 12395]|uniref:Nitrite/Sulfite reductase ferredoxin-like half domain-containing protein n=1 Tax=Desulforamulus putei DSM 12395 TaxID=1121429 RepID=A0A1M5C501_9FIRM|nr:NAD(P)/FAD-dependent oxidoreductase [Desulforamulus putei]SHF49677.1 Nitrite/Sulfite reductase ferredoxin-like half domain-containing protein [Desulforamulus putei DSM 12395]
MGDAPKAAILQRDNETYAIVPKTGLAGLLNAETLRKLADVVEKYQIPVVKLTASQRIALVGIKGEDVNKVWEDLGMEPAPATGLCVRSVQSCPGSTLCKYGKQDSLGLAAKLDELFSGTPLPNKFKMGISGCPLNCCEAWTRDFGAFGKSNGFTVVIGGNAGAAPHIGKVLAEGLSQDEVVALATRLINFYKENAKNGERMFKFVERLGIEEIQKAVLT